ncbi:MAG: peptidoglycan editing factor PgeF [Clostridiales bacterium]|nr:peptidoglycan editing factor PgeF [Clostridiales bacterium]
MKKNIKNGIPFYTFENFEKHNLRHAFSSKTGGVSAGCFAALNLGFRRGDADENVRKNFRALAEAVGFSYEDMVFSDQVHETAVRAVGKSDRGKGYLRESDIVRTDGLMTNEPGVVLTTFYADCVPLYFYDPAHRAIALSHAGWRGTLNKIGGLTVAKMQETYGSKPEEIIAGIGPSIGPCCFEVDLPVVEEFHTGLSFAADFIAAHKESAGKYLIDLWGVNKKILADAGLKPENIETAELCTQCNSDTFYSHRVMGKERGSMAAFLALGES